MNILNYFDDIVEKFQIARWTNVDRNNLFRVVLEVYQIDGVFSESERDNFEGLIAGLKVEKEVVEAIDFQEALFALKSDEGKTDLLHFWIADALFADNDYDFQEQAFIDKIVQKYELKEAKLRNTIQRVRDEKFEAILESWLA